MSASKNLEYEKTSFLNKSNSAFIERMYLKFVNKDSDLPDSWKDYFEGIGEELNIIAKEINGPSWGPKKNTIDIDELQKKIDQEDQNSNDVVVNVKGENVISSRSNEDSIKAVSMIRSYRQRGHLIAKLDPLGLLKSDYLDELHPDSFGFKKADYQKHPNPASRYAVIGVFVAKHKKDVNVAVTGAKSCVYIDKDLSKALTNSFSLSVSFFFL